MILVRLGLDLILGYFLISLSDCIKSSFDLLLDFLSRGILINYSQLQIIQDIDKVFKFILIRFGQPA